jgi:hypothetical protein
MEHPQSYVREFSTCKDSKLSPVRLCNSPFCVRYLSLRERRCTLWADCTMSRPTACQVKRSLVVLPKQLTVPLLKGRIVVHVSLSSRNPYRLLYASKHPEHFSHPSTSSLLSVIYQPSYHLLNFPQRLVPNQWLLSRPSMP